MAIKVHKEVKWCKALVLGAGKYDYTNKLFRPKMYRFITKSFNLNTKDLKSRSALNWADKLSKDVPILLLHGTSDWRVSADNSLRFSLELYKNKVPYKLVIYPGGNHGLSGFIDETTQEVIMHFDKYLLNGEKVDLNFHGK